MLRVSRVSKFFPSEPGKETEATPAVCGLMLPATGGRLTAETGTDPLPEVGTRKRKSRWSDAPPEKTATTGTQPEVVTLTSEGTPTGLNEEQHQQLLEQIEVCVCVCVCVTQCDVVNLKHVLESRLCYISIFQINRIVAEIRAARQKRGNKYDYDSDEEVENGTWEHRLRAKEMIETEGNAPSDSCICIMVEYCESSYVKQLCMFNTNLFFFNSIFATLLDINIIRWVFCSDDY